MTKRTRKHALRQTVAELLWFATIFLMLGVFTPAQAGDVPPCALTGSMTVMIGGKPALRLSDVAHCAPELYEIISSVQIDGQPMVHFKPAEAGKVRCITLPNPTVMAEGKHLSALGDVACTAKP